MSKLIDAARELRGTSELADSILTRRFPEAFESNAAAVPDESSSHREVLDEVLTDKFDTSAPGAVDKLLTVIVRLSNTVNSQRGQIEELLKHLPEEEVSDENKVKEVSAFRTALEASDARIGDLKIYYDLPTFKKLKQETRLIVAKELVAYAVARGREPSELWTVLVNNNGVIV